MFRHSILKHNCLLYSAVLIALFSVSGSAQASDFSIIFYFFRGLYLFLALLLLFIAWRITKVLQNKWLLGIIWGTVLALITTPMNTKGGNGTSHSAALEDILVSLMGGDSIYGIEALNALMLFTPVWILACVLFFFLKQRQDQKNSHSE